MNEVNYLHRVRELFLSGAGDLSATDRPVAYRERLRSTVSVFVKQKNTEQREAEKANGTVELEFLA